MNAIQFFEGLTTYNSLFILSALGLAYLLGIFSMQGYMMVLRQKLKKSKRQNEQLQNDLKVAREEYLQSFEGQPNQDVLDDRARYLQEEFTSFKEDFQDSIEFYVHSIDELSESNHQLLKKVKALQLENEHLIKTVWSNEDSYQSFAQDVRSPSSISVQIDEPLVLDQDSSSVAAKNIKHWIGALQEPVAQDSLSQIKGISKSIEKRINALGILSFKQLSLLDDALIDDLAKAIKYQKGRIKREDWVGQAMKFLK